MLFLGSDYKRNIRKLSKIANEVDSYSEKYKKMSDSELKGLTQYFRDEYSQGKTLEEILPEAYAAVREASARVLKMRHFYVQILGGISLHQGRIAEMKTGEGKTLVETLPAYLNAITQKNVHIVTVNEYLASRDAEWMGKVFKFMGLKVGVTLSGMSREDKKKAYQADITYGTNAEFGFDYLRDNMAVKIDQRVQRGLDFAIIDEVDSVLIDEARTPLVVSGKGSKASDDVYKKVKNFVSGLKLERDVEFDEEKKLVRLLDDGVEKAENYFGIENLSDVENTETNHHIQNALKAKYIMKRDSEYIVRNGEIHIVDEFTGRVLSGRRFSDGLHQAIEAKEGVEIKTENQTMATITYQNYFRKYKKLSGMTGTAKTEEKEFNKIYDLDVVEIPTNKPMRRIDRNDTIFKTSDGKYKAIIEEIKKRNSLGQPTLVGTTTVDRSEQLSKELKKFKIKHSVLNAKNHEKESEIVAQAGKLSAVTIATNMAGRGTDIILGGNPEFLAKKYMKQEGFDDYTIAESDSFAESDDENINNAKKRYNELLESYKQQTDKEKEEVLKAGGLFVLGTERHDSRRIDNQLRGRSGRQGDPGESVFYISLEDDLARLFGGERLKRVASMLNLDEDQPLTSMKLVSRNIENAQKRIEGRNFTARKTLLEFDDVLASQREIVYEQREKVLKGESVRDQIEDMISELAENTVRTHVSDRQLYSEWNLEDLNKGLRDKIFDFLDDFITEENIAGKEVAEVCKMVKKEALSRYNNKIKDSEEIGLNFSELERAILLRQVDIMWMEHIDHMTLLRQEISTRSNPIEEYKKEGFDMFDGMISRIREYTAKILSKGRVRKDTQVSRRGPAATQAGPVRKTISKQKQKKPGRNEPCYCGSGKKYKNCHGR